MWGRIKLDKADVIFSQFIRLRDKECARCHSRVETRDGLPVSHNCSHYHGRGHEGTRFDPNNAVTLCFPCHRLWEGEERDAYTNLIIKKLGLNEFKILSTKAHTFCRRDRKLALRKVKFLLESLNN